MIATWRNILWLHHDIVIVCFAINCSSDSVWTECWQFLQHFCFLLLELEVRFPSFARLFSLWWSFNDNGAAVITGPHQLVFKVTALSKTFKHIKDRFFFGHWRRFGPSWESNHRTSSALTSLWLIGSNMMWVNSAFQTNEKASGTWTWELQLTFLYFLKWLA